MYHGFHHGSSGEEDEHVYFPDQDRTQYGTQITTCGEILPPPYAPVLEHYTTYYHGQGVPLAIDAELGYPSFAQPQPVEQHYYPYQSQILPEIGSTDASNTPFPEYSTSLLPAPQQFSPQFLQPAERPPASDSRVSRSGSLASNDSSIYSLSEGVSRSGSPSAAEMSNWGFRNDQGGWSCGFPGCASKSIFHRGCDLRKHYRRHTKSLFCRHPGCPQATEGGFSSNKDRSRHEAKHNPQIVCEREGCNRLFSRMDNMKDHVRRIHDREIQ